MKKMLRKGLVVTLACASLALSATAYATPCPTLGQYSVAGTCKVPTPDESWDLLVEGNTRFQAGVSSAFVDVSESSTIAARQALAAGQKPLAIVLTCSDSRVTPEMIFDKGLGEIFVIRVAGNIVDPHELGSIEYAIEHLHTNLVVVLGHEKCGAVKATYASYPVDGDPADGIGSLVHSIYPAVDAVVTAAGGKVADTNPVGQAVQIEECILDNIKKVADSLLTRSDIIREYVDGNGSTIPADSVKIVRAKYTLGSGAVALVP